MRPVSCSLRVAASLLLISGLSPAAVRADDEPAATAGHFGFVGPISRFAPEGGKAPAPVTSGLPFAIKIADNGSSVTPGKLDLVIPGVQDPLSMTLTGLKYDGGHLTGSLKLTNATGAVVEGLRLDVTGATETYPAKDDQGNALKDEKGNPVLKTREQKAEIASPLLFGDLPKGKDSPSLALDVSGIALAPDAIQVSVNGVLSGARLLNQWTSEEIVSPAEIVTDAKNRLYFADVVESRVLRCDLDGKNKSTVAKLPDQCLGVAVHPKTGQVYAIAINHPGIFKFTAGGEDDGKITSEDIPNLGLLHTDSQGSLYGVGDRGIAVFDGEKFVRAIEKIGDFEVAPTGFDVAPNGTLWVCSNDSLFTVDSTGDNGKRIASGPDWHLGRVTGPTTCRVGPKGNVYVLEAGIDLEDKYEPPRLSVFDPQGRFVRAMGHAGATAKSDDEPLPGQIKYPIDLAFDADGHLVVLGKVGGGNSASLIQVYQLF